jgi:hypothetical protein
VCRSIASLVLMQNIARNRKQVGSEVSNLRSLPDFEECKIDLLNEIFSSFRIGNPAP